MSLLALVNMTPLGKGESVSRHVARVVDVIDRSGLPYVVTSMGTIIEGESWNEIMELLKKGFTAMRTKCNRITISIKIDYRRGKAGRIEAKLKSIEKKLGRITKKIT